MLLKISLRKINHIPSMFNFIKNLNFCSILTIVFLIIASITSLTTSFITLRDISIRNIYFQNDLIAMNYADTLSLSFKFITSPLKYGKEYMNRYTIFNSTLDDFISLSTLNNTSINRFVNSLSLYYIVSNVNRASYETRMSELLKRDVTFNDFNNIDNSFIISGIRNIYCPKFFTTKIDNMYPPGLDVCILREYSELINTLLYSPLDTQVINTRKTINSTLIDFGTNTVNGFLSVTLIVENIIDAYISDSEQVSILQKGQEIFTNCKNNCENMLMITKDISLPNGEILVVNFFFNEQTFDITTFLFILLGILLILFIISCVIYNFEVQKNRYILADKMLGYINHEMRNPLNCINGLIDLSLIQYESNLENDNTDEEIKNDLLTAKIACDLLNHIINDILDLKKINNGKLDINNTNINVDDFVNKLQKILSTKINEHSNIQFHFRNPECITNIYFDEQRLLQILINFITNALKYTETGSIILLIEYIIGNISIDVEKNIRKIRISIKDTGRGIKIQDYNNIFKPFDQNNLNKNSQSGIGLGLYLCKMIIDQTGGKIGFDSEFGIGSTFYIEFYENIILV